MNRIVRRWANWRVTYKQCPARQSKSLSLTRGIQAMFLRKSPKSMGFSWKLSNCPRPSAVLSCCPGDGWSTTPNHNTPETLGLTDPTLRPMLGISGLLNLLTWVEHRQLAQASPHEEGGVPCPVPHSTQLPPAQFQTGRRSVGGSAASQSAAAPLAAESSARTPVGAKPRTRQGGRG